METNLLPTVREGTYDSVSQSLIEDYKTDGEFILEYLEHLKKVNPQILLFILKWLDKFEGKRYIYCLVGMCALYKLLESEAEAIQFEKEEK